MSTEFRSSKARAAGGDFPRSRRGILQSPPHEDEVGSNSKANPVWQSSNVEAGEGSNSRRDELSILVHEFREIVRENQLNQEKCFKVLLSGLKETLAEHAKKIGMQSQSRFVASNEAITPTSSPIPRPRKRTPASAPVGPKKKKSSVAMWNDVKKASAAKPSFDPNFPPYDHRSISSFQKWYLKGSSGSSVSPLRLESKVVPVVDCHWFDCIWGNGSLEMQQMDVVASVIVRDHDVDRAWYPSRKWTLLDSHTWEVLEKADFSAVPACLWPYMIGSLPKEGAKPWSKATRVFGFAKVTSKNWVCYEISFEKQRITVFDPSSLPWSVVVEAFSNLRNHIPAMCKMARIWESKGFSTPLLPSWEVVPYPNPPKSENHEDSSVMSLKVMQALAYNLEPSSLLGFRCSAFRKHMCGSIFCRSPDFAAISHP